MCPQCDSVTSDFVGHYRDHFHHCLHRECLEQLAPVRLLSHLRARPYCTQRDLCRACVFFGKQTAPLLTDSETEADPQGSLAVLRGLFGEPRYPTIKFIVESIKRVTERFLALNSGAARFRDSGLPPARQEPPRGSLERACKHPTPSDQH